MTPKQWRRCAIVAHEQHDRDALELALDRLIAPDLQHYDRNQLLERRVDLLRSMADVHDRLAAMDGPGRVTAHMPPFPPSPAGGSIDPSDPT